MGRSFFFEELLRREICPHSEEHLKGESQLMDRAGEKRSTMNPEVKNVLISGVGGQGVLLVSEILSRAVMESGDDVKKSEVHGMAQRGGSVVSHVRYGPNVRSPLIEKGSAQVLLALEELEALRWSEYLSPDGTIILNRQQLKPMPVAMGLQEYPADIIAQLSRKAARVAVVDGIGIARKTGLPGSFNIVMLGALAAHLGLNAARLRRILKAKLPPQSLAANLSAFAGGWKAMAEIHPDSFTFKSRRA